MVNNVRMFSLLVLVLGMSGGALRAQERGHSDALFHDVRHASWSPDGQQLLVTVDYGGNQEIDLMSRDGAFLKALVRSPGADGVAQWSAARDEILFQTARDADDGPAFTFYTMRPDGSRLRRLVDFDGAVMFGKWSPDGSALLFNDVFGPKPRQVYLMDLETKKARQLTSSDEAHSDYGSWSPDGRWVLFESDRSGSWDTYRMRPDGSEVTLLGLGGSSAPRYSPDGTRIAFHEVRNGLDYDVFIANADGTEARLLAGGGGDQRLPEWSPDGRTLAYVSNAGGHHDLFILGVDGGEPVRLTRQPEDEFFTVLAEKGLDAAKRYFETAHDSDPERKVFRDDRGLFLAVNGAFRDGEEERAHALLELGLKAFPESGPLQALRDGKRGGNVDY